LTTKERINAIFDVLYDGGGGGGVAAPRNSCEHLLSIRSWPATGQPIFLIIKVKKKHAHISRLSRLSLPRQLFSQGTSVSVTTTVRANNVIRPEKIRATQAAVAVDRSPINLSHVRDGSTFKTVQ
jgi:hypothetical protein